MFGSYFLEHGVFGGGGALRYVLNVARHHWYRKRTIQRMRKIPRSLVATVENEYARIVGTAAAHGGSQVYGAVTGRRCLAYELEVQVGRGVRPDWFYLEPVFEACEFSVNDGTGILAVIPQSDAEIVLLQDAAWNEVSSKQERRRLVEIYRDRRPIRRGWLLREPALRYREAILAPGETVAVSGYVARTREDAGPESPAKSMRGTDATPVAISDLVEPCEAE